MHPPQISIKNEQQKLVVHIIVLQPQPEHTTIELKKLWAHFINFISFG